ncbi:MAG: PAS domain S-box protein [Clostridia bacterium]|nr:PAS domain S-box protein [Clostridia bacterium]
MTIIYCIILTAFIVTVIYLVRSILIKYNEQFILTRASEKISDGYLIFTSNGKITNYNEAILNLFKFKKKELKDKSIYDVFNRDLFEADDINKILDACKKIKNSNEIIKFDIKTRGDNRIFKIEIKSIVNNDIFLRYVMICKDVTNTYQIIEELQNNQDMMANKEKFAILGQLISRNCTFFEVSNLFYIRRDRGGQ